MCGRPALATAAAVRSRGTQDTFHHVFLVATAGRLSRFQFLTVRDLIMISGTQSYVVIGHLTVSQDNSRLGARIVDCGLSKFPGMSFAAQCFIVGMHSCL